MSTLRNLMQAVGARCWHKCLPDSYLVIDVETSGFTGSINPNSRPACAVQFGVAAVRGRKITSRDAQCIRRPLGTMQPAATNANRITDAMLVDGTLPEIFYPRLINLLETFRRDRCPFVGHNIVGFDREFINMDIAQNGFNFEIEPHEVVDTGLIYKASRMCVEPRADELLSHFFKRIAATRSSIKWNLALTMRELHLDTRFSLNLDDAHDAGFDCYMTHLLFEELRQLSDGAPSGY